MARGTLPALLAPALLAPALLATAGWSFSPADGRSATTLESGDDLSDEADPADGLLLRSRSTSLEPDDAPELAPDAPELAPDAIPAVVITEVMWYPTSGPEWLELYNPGPSAIALDGLLLTDNEGADLAEGESWFATGTTLPGYGYLVIGAATAEYVDLVWARGGPALANSGDEVYLVSDPQHDGLFSASEVIDGFRYSTSWGGNGNGKTLSRTCLDCASTDPASWSSSAAIGGTPGAQNDVGSWDTEPTPVPTPVPLPGAGKKVLFDQAHCQTCSDADWTINGGYSDFANALRDVGFTVSSSTSAFSSSLLSGYDVLVIPEPNTPFSSAERDALVAFAKSGKGIYMIADHYNSDRNGDGWDSVEVFNGYLSGTRTTSNDWLATNFGFRFYESTYNQDPVTNIKSSSITAGVSKVGWYGGTAIQIVNATTVKSAICLNSSTKALVATVTPTTGGRVVAHGDSSTFDDGSCSCGDDLHPNFDNYDHPDLAVNSVLWLAGVL